MKIKASIKKRCSLCKIIKRHKKILIICLKGKHKQKQG